MTKALVVIVIIVGIWLFVPRFDLYERKVGFGDDSYELADAGFWSIDDCRAAGKEKFKKNYYRCYRVRAWDTFMGKSIDYASEKPID